MPRVPVKLVQKAASTLSPRIAQLLPICRDLQSAQNELRWIREHAEATLPPHFRRIDYHHHHHHAGATVAGYPSWHRAEQEIERRVAAMCRRRSRGVPLQYILGSQPFGSLDIRCAPGVLIPRTETEAYTVYLAQLLRDGALDGAQAAIDVGQVGGSQRLQQPQRTTGLNIIDFCTGTGCIPLLLYALLARSLPWICTVGVDISPKALDLADENLHQAAQQGHLPRPAEGRGVYFVKGDVFDKEWVGQTFGSAVWDVLVANPPYVSPDAWRRPVGKGGLSRSARRHEPELALVPPPRNRLGPFAPPPGWRPEDVFYPAILDVAQLLRTRLVLLEVGDETQACRVLSAASRHAYLNHCRIEIWRDNPDIEPVGGGVGHVRRRSILNADGTTRQVRVRGTGNVRCIFLTKDAAFP